MPNKNYIKGRRKEYKLCKELKKEGFDIVQRTAGSHSPVDILAIDMTKMIILLVQAKPDNYKEKKYDLYKKFLAGRFDVKFEIR